ncbi:fumarylacetoacetate hydrolase family protein [Helcobacillus massiliensis]|uniref:2-keto-4-pentenoate hydratase/2-oxohepta-3-ene-1,7-dioic acid hydratase in catechol pathway n=1 Tax=Helcobacillus massiliensis TaxID=521392 RepID=A0A839QQ84_9MICO|nr:fumarylacetoacetate hydrolase family protein [Helcobacillus massiliensis]MBB3022162.1 2-keto-4-pentenoate hydratase/2-oxohepta-3-ene-1,7-dioic acid hydratase in catechol pathway [Helcobacillus massiliensis]
MRIARFTDGSDPMFGIVQEKDGVDMVYGLAGDPLFTEITPNGVIRPLEDVRLLSPVIPRSKVVCVGKNYAQHAKEMGGEAPEQPLLFMKPNTAVIGPMEPMFIPTYSSEVSLEAELAVVIKQMAKNVDASAAAGVVFGYTCGNDFTARDSQREEDQWFRAKAFDTSCALGPWIETDLDPSALAIGSEVNGEAQQDGTTADMIHPVADIIAEVSRVTTLLPGDVILTGTPAGVAQVADGDRVTVRIQGIGELTTPISSAATL